MSLAGPPGSGRAPPMHWCHECRIEIRPLMTPLPTCPRCNSGFVEEIDPSNTRPEEEDEDDDAMQAIFGRPFAGAEGRSDRPSDPSSDGPMDLGTLMGGLLRGLATAGSQSRPERPSSSPGPQQNQSSQTQSQGSNSNPNNGNANFRSGTSQFGGMNVSWGVGSYQHNSQTAQASATANTGTSSANAQPPIGLHDFVRRSFQTSDQPPDDGMGGAGAAADGRFFNHDNDRSGGATTSSSQDSQDDNENRYPPELASLRDLFSNLFGGFGEGPANIFADIFGSGRSGDYVFNQEGLDNVITQLMDQTRGSTAPPPASEESIAELPRFSRHEKAKVKEARNRECSTCMDSFLEGDEDEDTEMVEPSLDSNRLSSTMPGGPSVNDDDEDPPEVIPGEEDQQEELIMMPCKHLFHLDCLLPWLKTNGTCPVCRVSLAKQKEKEKPSSSNTSNNGQAESSNATSMSNTISVEEDDVDDESPQTMRERMRRAAEERRGSANQQMVPGSFLQPDELD